MHVVSLLPAATEICFALEVEPVGVSHECDHPPAARDLPAVNELRIDVSGSSEAINQAVAEAAEGEGVYAIDRERLAALDPDLVVTQGVCDVCAVDQVQVRDVIGELGLDAEVLTLDVHSLADLYDAIERVGAATDRADAARTLITSLRERTESVAAQVSDNAVDVAVLDWLDPVMVAGHWMPELVELAGGRYGLASAGEHSRPREWQELREYDPDVIVVSPCGFDLEQIRANVAELTERPGWASLAAVRNDRVFLVDGHEYVNRAGPRLVETLEYLAAFIHPDTFPTPPADAVEPLE